MRINTHSHTHYASSNTFRFTFPYPPSFDDFKALHGGVASMAKLKEAGKYRQEGKTYVMQDGDIVLFQFNVTGAKKK